MCRVKSFQSKHSRWLVYLFRKEKIALEIAVKVAGVNTGHPTCHVTLVALYKEWNKCDVISWVTCGVNESSIYVEFNTEKRRLGKNWYRFIGKCTCKCTCIAFSSNQRVKARMTNSAKRAIGYFEHRQSKPWTGNAE